MSQQASIMIMIDVEGALANNTLKGFTYMFDNMGYQGSTGQGTSHLTTGVAGEYWIDGTQADEIVLNWLSVGIASLPLTLPKNFHVQRSRESELESFRALKKLQADLKNKESKRKSKDKAEEYLKEIKEVHEKIDEIQKNKGIMSSAEVAEPTGKHFGHKVLDLTGNIAENVDQPMSGISYPIPEIVNLRGEAIDKNIIYVDAMSYPDSDPRANGWYWCGTVYTGNPGTYKYILDITLYKPIKVSEHKVHFEPTTMEFESYFKIINEPMVNGFTKRGIGLLPV